jgi:hypothetical protein
LRHREPVADLVRRAKAATLVDTAMCPSTTLQPPGEYGPPPDAEFLVKCRHLSGVLACAGLDDSEDLAAAWLVAFYDEEDPTFVVVEWIQAGWRDPLLIGAVLRICGDRSRAEACLGLIGIDVGTDYDQDFLRHISAAVNRLQGPSNDAANSLI